MPRRDNRTNPLEIKTKAVSVPRSVSRKRYLQTLLKVIDNGADLPRGWEVEIWWRNRLSRGSTRFWRSDDFVDAIADSRSGFVSILRRAIVSKIRRLS
jgi:hypothetical protein